MVRDREAWSAAVHGVAKNQTWLGDWRKGYSSKRSRHSNPSKGGIEQKQNMLLAKSIDEGLWYLWGNMRRFGSHLSWITSRWKIKGKEWGEFPFLFTFTLSVFKVIKTSPCPFNSETFRQVRLNKTNFFVWLLVGSWPAAFVYSTWEILTIDHKEDR